MMFCLSVAWASAVRPFRKPGAETVTQTPGCFVSQPAIDESLLLLRDPGLATGVHRLHRDLEVLVPGGGEEVAADRRREGRAGVELEILFPMGAQGALRLRAHRGIHVAA